MTWVSYYDFTESCVNCKKVSNVFDLGGVTPVITYDFGTGTGGQWSINPNPFSWEFDFQHPEIGSITYGMAKRNEQWHGSRLVF